MEVVFLDWNPPTEQIYVHGIYVQNQILRMESLQLSNFCAWNSSKEAIFAHGIPAGKQYLCMEFL